MSKFNLNSVWKYIGGGATVLSYQAFYDSTENAKAQRSLKQSIDDINDNINEVKELIKSGKASERDTQNVDSYNDLLKFFKKMLDANKKQESRPITEEDKASVFEGYKTEFTEAFEKAKNISDIIKKDNDSSNKFSDDSYIIQLIKDFKDYLSTLSTTEICLVINISSSLFILSCLVTILFSVYGNFFINKLSLEEKYPKLAIFIKLRVKLQHSYILINTLLIFVALILMIIINFITLTNGR